MANWEVTLSYLCPLTFSHLHLNSRLCCIIFHEVLVCVLLGSGLKMIGTWTGECTPTWPVDLNLGINGFFFVSFFIPESVLISDLGWQATAKRASSASRDLININWINWLWVLLVLITCSWMLLCRISHLVHIWKTRHCWTDLSHSCLHQVALWRKAPHHSPMNHCTSPCQRRLLPWGQECQLRPYPCHLLPWHHRQHTISSLGLDFRRLVAWLWRHLCHMLSLMTRYELTLMPTFT